MKIRRALLSVGPWVVSATAILMLSPVPAAAHKGGVAAAVNPTATGNSPGGSARKLEIGSEIVHNHRIQTSESGSTQVIFVDRSTLTISPGANVVIDKFIYNPASNSADVAITMSKGLMRFVVGRRVRIPQPQIFQLGRLSRCQRPDRRSAYRYFWRRRHVLRFDALVRPCRL